MLQPQREWARERCRQQKREREHRCNRFLVSIFHVENWPLHPAVWSMGAVVLRKNLSKCVISPLMEHRRKAILLIPLSLVLLGCFHTPFLPSSSCSLMSPFHYQPSIYQPFPLLKEWLSSHTVLDGVIAVVYLPPCSRRASAHVFSYMSPKYFTSKGHFCEVKTFWLVLQSSFCLGLRQELGLGLC